MDHFKKSFPFYPIFFTLFHANKENKDIFGVYIQGIEFCLKEWWKEIENVGLIYKNVTYNLIKISRKHRNKNYI